MKLPVADSDHTPGLTCVLCGKLHFLPMKLLFFLLRSWLSKVYVQVSIYKRLVNYSLWRMTYCINPQASKSS